MCVTFIVIMSTIFVLLIISVIIFLINTKSQQAKTNELLKKRIDIELTTQNLMIMMQDENDAYHIKEDKSTIEFVENIIQKYIMYMNKWMIANLEILQIIDRDKLTPKLKQIEIENCRLLIKENHPIIVEITNLYNEIRHVYDELIKKGLNYCNSKINELNKKLQ